MGRHRWLWFIYSLVLCCPAYASTILWSEGFESGGFTGWTGADANWSVISSTLSAHTGLRGADVKGNTAPDDDQLWLNLTTTGFAQLQLSYWYKIREALESADQLVVEWTATGSDWFPLVTYNDVAASDWQLASYSLPLPAANNPQFALRLRATLGSATDRLNFDDFQLSGVVTPEPGMFTLLIFGLGIRSRVR